MKIGVKTYLDAPPSSSSSSKVALEIVSLYQTDCFITYIHIYISTFLACSDFFNEVERYRGKRKGTNLATH